MLLLLLAYLGGVLTILSPCILPVLPFVFARADQPFLRNGLPLLIGMAADRYSIGLGIGLLGISYAVCAIIPGLWIPEHMFDPTEGSVASR